MNNKTRNLSLDKITGLPQLKFKQELFYLKLRFFYRLAIELSLKIALLLNAFHLFIAPEGSLCGH